MKFARIPMFCLALSLVVAIASPGRAADKGLKAGDNIQQVEFFDAIKNGDIGVKFIPKDAKEANVLIENKRKKPLAIKLPEAFAGVPVLAQMGMGGMGGMGMGGMGMGGMGGNQGMGGGMGGMGGMGMGGMGGGGMGGGFFAVEPDKVRKIKVPTVCLEHGKKDPNPRVAYEIRPIESFTKDAKVVELCKMVGRGEIPQNTAQAAAWHLTDNLSWAELANKNRIQLRNGYTEKYFSPQEVVFAMRVANEASRRAKQNPISPGEIDEKIDSLSRK